MERPFGLDRPLDNKHMQSLLLDIMKRISRSDYAGYVMLIDSNEAGWSYQLPTSWNAIYPEPRSDLGVRIRGKSSVPEDVEKIRLAAHTFVNMIRAGDMLVHIGTQFIRLMEQHGMTVEYDREEPPPIVGL